MISLILKWLIGIEVRKNDHFRDMTESFNQLMAQLEKEEKPVEKAQRTA